MKQLIQKAELLERLGEFAALYTDRPIRQNAGGMGFNHAFGTYCIARKLEPSTIIESGVWMGQSTWVLQQACPNAELICIDPNPNVRKYTAANAIYHEQDFQLIDWSNVDTSKALCFFDDHQNAYQRLMEMRWWGFSRAIFEDNFPCGVGDFYSMRHAFAEFGHPQIQMSQFALEKGLRAKITRWLDHKVLYKYHDRQTMVRKPNRVDRAGLEKNLSAYQEIPPVIRYAKTGWGDDWTGPNASEPPLFEDFPEGDLGRRLRQFEDEHPGQAFQYTFICAVALRR
ncbi:MAG: hypothetical protein AAGF86_06570 [Pseudomonadota bacterium]